MNYSSAVAPHRVRKLRKGTHSCQQCRRRKARCIHDAGETKICVGCKSRGLECRPQTIVSDEDEPRNAPSTAERASTDGLAERIEKLEKLISSMASSGSPGDLAPTRTSHSVASSQNILASSQLEPDVIDCSVAQTARLITSPSNDPTHCVTTHITDSFGSSPSMDGNFIEVAFPSEQNIISAQLYAQIPPESTSSTLISNVPSMFLGPHGPVSHNRQIRPTDHPALIAKRLMMLALCLQQLPSSFDLSRLEFPGHRDPKDTGAIIRTWIDAISTLVTSNDILVSNVEGVETLVLQAIVQGDSGQLRKAWMTGRKAISLSMLLGLHHDQPSRATLITSCIPGQPVPPQVIESLWFRANCVDRYASLVLGLPPTSTDVSFASERRARQDTPEDRLGKVYAVCAGRISERNAMLLAGQDAQALTNSIELDLESVSHLVDSAWWHPPDFFQIGSGLSDELMVMNVQVRHYVLTVLLQLPYMLQQQASREELHSQQHSHVSCMHACRAVVHRFLRFRRVYKSIATGRQIDYAALLSSMTLLHGHIVRQKPTAPGSTRDESMQPADMELVESARQIMEETARCNSGDCLSSEAAKSLEGLLIHLRECGVCDGFAVGLDGDVGEELPWHYTIPEPLGLQEQLFDGLDPTVLFSVESF